MLINTTERFTEILDRIYPPRKFDKGDRVEVKHQLPPLDRERLTEACAKHRIDSEQLEAILWRVKKTYEYPKYIHFDRELSRVVNSQLGGKSTQSEQRTRKYMPDDPWDPSITEDERRRRFASNADGYRDIALEYAEKSARAQSPAKRKLYDRISRASEVMEQNHRVAAETGKHPEKSGQNSALQLIGGVE